MTMALVLSLSSLLLSMTLSLWKLAIGDFEFRTTTLILILWVEIAVTEAIISRLKHEVG